MAPEDALDVERRRAEAFGNGQDLGLRDEHEDCLRVQEAPDQPRARDPVDLRSRSRDPECPALRITRWHALGVDQQGACRCPRFEAALERLRTRAGMTKQCRHALAQLLATMADDCDGAARESVDPGRGVLPIPAHRAGKDTGVGPEVLVGPHIDQDGRVGQADEADQLGDGDSVGGRHERPLQIGSTGRDASAEASRGDRRYPLATSVGRGRCVVKWINERNA